MTNAAIKAKVPPGILDHIDWNHGPPKWDIVYREPYGRCMVANDDIKEGEVLFVDHPVVTGPKQNCGIMCLGCYKQLDSEEALKCSKCSWSVCSSQCENAGYHPMECKVLSASGYTPLESDFSDAKPMYESILPLRCLLLRKAFPDKWKTMNAMESHTDMRRGSELWEIEQKNVCDFLRQKIKIEESDEEVHNVVGILDVNCHEVRSNIPGTRDEYRVRGIYPLCAMMSHDCSSNTHHTVMEGMMMLVVASRDIPKGDQVTGTYTHLLSGTIERRKHLKYGKFFDCLCQRCRDPTEMGTYFSALRCSKSNCGGNVLPKDTLTPNNVTDFECEKCHFEVRAGVVNRLTNMIYMELQSSGENDPQDLEEIFRKYQGILHPNHYHLIGIKHSLSQIYGRVEGFLIGDLTNAQMDRKVECCRDLLTILMKLDPGISRLRGLTLYEMHAPLLLRANRAFQSKTIMKKNFLETLNYCLSLLEKSIYCLQFEPISSFEGEICKIAKNSAEELRKWIATVEELPEVRFLQPIPPASPPTEKSEADDLTLQSLLKKIEEY